MPFSLVPGEQLRKELRFEFKGGGLFFTPSTTLRVTNRRVVATESFKRGSEITKYMPLESILYMQEGRFSSTRLLLAGIVLIFVGIIATLTLIGAIAGIPMVIAGVICLILYWFKRSQVLMIDSGGSDTIVLSIQGQNSLLEELIEEIELARMERSSDSNGHQKLNAVPSQTLTT